MALLATTRLLLLCALLISFCISEIACAPTIFGLTDVSRRPSSSLPFRTGISTRAKEGQSYQIRSILHPIGTQAARRLTTVAGKAQDGPAAGKGQGEETLSGIPPPKSEETLVLPPPIFLSPPPANVTEKEGAAGKANNTPPTSSLKEPDHDIKKDSADKSEGATPDKPDHDIKEDGIDKSEGDTPDNPDPSAKNDDTGRPGKDPKPSSKQNNECAESHCEDADKVLSACLRTDGTHMLSLSITNEGDDNVTVKVLAPAFLTAEPPELLVRKGTTETVQFIMDSKTAAEVLDAEVAKSMNITITSGHGMCEIGVPIEYLRSLTQQGHLSYSSLFTPMAGIYALLFVLVMAAGIWMYCRYQERKRSSEGVKYQELEMNVAVGSPKERVSKSGGESTDGWDEVWDDDWEDTEAARSSSRMSQSLSSRGLAARRGNKDGWDNSWDD